MRAELIAEVLARAFLAGEADLYLLEQRGAVALGAKPRWLSTVARQFAERYGAGSAPRYFDVVKLLLQNSGLQRAQFQLLARMSA